MAIGDKGCGFVEIIAGVPEVTAAVADNTNPQSGELENNVAIVVVRIKFLFIWFYLCTTKNQYFSSL